MGEVDRNPAERRRIRRGPLLGAATLIMTLPLAACASSGQPQQSAPSSASVTSAPVASSATTESVSAAPGGAVTTLQGTVTEGVENGCVVLVDASGAVLANLQGWDLRAHPFDSQVEVTGAFEPDMMTTCQQGTPFEASTVVSR
jgi:hypothetical protein